MVQTLTRVAGFRVLVIEDEPETIRTSLDDLRSAGWNLEIAQDQIGAEAALRRESFSVLILDLRIPRVWGTGLPENTVGQELLSGLEAGRFGPLNGGTPCIVYTGQMTGSHWVLGSKRRYLTTLSKNDMDGLLREMDNLGSLVPLPLVGADGRQVLTESLGVLLSRGVPPIEEVRRFLRIPGPEWASDFSLHPRQRYLLARLAHKDEKPEVLHETLRVLQEYSLVTRTKPEFDGSEALPVRVNVRTDVDNGDPLMPGGSLKVEVWASPSAEEAIRQGLEGHFCTLGVLMRANPGGAIIEPDWFRFLRVNSISESRPVRFFATIPKEWNSGPKLELRIEVVNGSRLIGEFRIDTQIRV
jgi:CheY-like chemotaxis protein